MPNNYVDVLVRFGNEMAAKHWFELNRDDGLFPPDCGLRHADALEISGGRAPRGTFIVTREQSGTRWLVQPRPNPQELADDA